MGSDTLAIRFGIRVGDGLQTRSWAHHADSSLHSDPSFYCVLCGTKSEMAFAWTTLFNGQEALGDLCAACVGAGPAAAAEHEGRKAEEWREQAKQWREQVKEKWPTKDKELWREMADWSDKKAQRHAEVAQGLHTLDPAHWSTLAELFAAQEQGIKAFWAEAMEELEG